MITITTLQQGKSILILDLSTIELLYILKILKNYEINYLYKNIN